jgi:hypothetical protein
LKQLRAARQNGKLAYRIHGRVEVDGSGSIAFDRSGEVPLAALERFVPK